MNRPIGESSQFGGFGFPVSPETNMELHFHAGELQEARERQLGSVYDSPLSNLSEKPSVVADYISAIYSIDTFGNFLITRESIADLCAIKEQTDAVLAEFAPEGPSLEQEMYYLKLESTAWAYGSIDNIGQDSSYIEMAREVAKMLSPQKVRSVNMVRFAAKIWLDRFPDYQKVSAGQASSAVFGRLMRNELMRIEAACDGSRLSPSMIYERRQRALDTMSDYAFAAMPMSNSEIQHYLPAF